MADEQFTFFWDGPFSQWHRQSFKVEGETYNTAEQYMMAAKARLFGDTDTLKKIMKTTSPKEQKRLGREVKGYTDEKWDAVARQEVYTANHAKFIQNADLLEKLLATTGTLVEASPYDRKWGIGLKADDPKAKDRSQWRGLNWLGEVLTNLRDDLRKK